MLRALLWVALANPPTVSVDVDALALPHSQTEALHGELMTRLVEDGHAVGSAGAVVVRLTGGGDVVHIEVQHGRDVFMRDVTGEGALLRLAAIHATIELLAGVDAIADDPDPALGAPSERAVALSVREGAEAFVPAAIVAVVNAGHVVTPQGEGAAVSLCLATDGERAVVQVIEADQDCDALADPPPSDDLAGDIAAGLGRARTQLAQAREAPAVTPPVEAPVVPAPVIRPVAPPAAVEPPAPPPTPPWVGAIGIGLGIEARIRAIEPLVLVHGDAHHRSGAMLTARAAVAPSRTQTLGVADTFVTTGAGYRFAPGQRLRIELAAAAGVAIHAYAFSGDRGARLDFTAEVPAAIRARLGARVELGAMALVGLTARARRHLKGDDVVWARERFRVAALASLTIALGRKRSDGTSAE